VAEALQLFLLASLGSFIALAGGIVFLYSRRLSNSLKTHSVPFATGVLITVSLVALLPEAFREIGEPALIIILLSFFGAYLFEYFFVNIHHHEDDPHSTKNSSVALVIIGDTIHNFIDGIAIAASFFVHPGLGLVTALSTFLHEVPHEIGDFGILLRAKWKRKNILLVNGVSASTTVFGAFITYTLIGSTLFNSTLFIGIMLSISSGIFLYLGAIDFLPHISEGYKSKPKALIPLALGVAIMLVIITLVPMLVSKS